jgi:hypothetical protein
MNDTPRDCLSVGLGTESIGDTVGVEYQPVMTDGGQWDVSDPVNHSDFLPLDMANNIHDERVRERITWVDGFGRAYADALEDVDRGRGIETDGGRARDGQRSLDDARWSPDQMRLGDLDDEDDEEIDRGDGIETDGGTEIEPLADRLNTIAIGSGTDGGEKVTRVDTDLLQRALSIIEQLHWTEVDIRLVEPEDGWDCDNPAVLLSPPLRNTGILLAPLIEEDEEVNADE